MNLPGGYAIKETADTFNKPNKPLILYDLYSCPFCKKTREALNMLDIDYEVKPCPKNGKIYRTEVQNKGGKQQFPYLIDPNTGKEMYESSDIIDYVFSNYGPGSNVKEAVGLKSMTSTVTAGLSGLFRRTSTIPTTKPPKKPLVVWGYEPSPFTAIVLEKLSSLEIPYLLKTTPRGSPKRQELKDMTGYCVLPYLIDDNTGTAMFESADIIEYLDNTYA